VSKEVGEDGGPIQNVNHKPNEKLFYRGCTGDVSEIRTVFQEFSDSIKDISLLRDGKGYILFDTVESATVAMQALNGTQTAKGENIIVEYSRPWRSGDSVADKPSDSLYFTGCTGNVSEIKALFQEFSASLKDIYLNVDLQSGDHTGSGIVRFDSIESATAAMALDGTQTANGEKITLKYENPKPSKAKAEKPTLGPNRKIFFSGCTGAVSDIKNIFREFDASIMNIHLLNNPHSGDHSGRGFVFFDTVESATAAMQALNGTQTANGETITLNYSVKEKAKWGGSPRYRRGNT